MSFSKSNLKYLSTLKQTTVQLNSLGTTKAVEYFNRCFSEQERDSMKASMDSVDLSSCGKYLNQKDVYPRTYRSVMSTSTLSGRVDSARSFSGTKIKNHPVLGALKKKIEEGMETAYGGKVSCKFVLARERLRRVSSQYGSPDYWKFEYRDAGIYMELSGTVNASLDQLVAKRNSARMWKKSLKSEINKLQAIVNSLTELVPDEE